MAAALNLPIVVVIEHNRWSFGTRCTSEAAVRDWCDVAGAYGVPAIGVDGNDVLEVLDAASQALARARAGDGMSIIVAETYRMLGHAQHDAQKYVPPEELEEWRQRDPIARFEAYLEEFGFATKASLENVRSSVAQELDLAVEKALDEPFPEPEEARTRVYADPALDAGVPWTRREVPGYEDLRPASGAASATPSDAS